MRLLLWWQGLGFLRPFFFCFGDREGDRRKDRENLDSSNNRTHNLLKFKLLEACIFWSTGTFINLYTWYLEYVLYVLYACMRIQLASPAESGMTIILERLCIIQLKPYTREINHICNILGVIWAEWSVWAAQWHFWIIGKLIFRQPFQCKLLFLLAPHSCTVYNVSHNALKRGIRKFILHPGHTLRFVVANLNISCWLVYWHAKTDWNNEVMMHGISQILHYLGCTCITAGTSLSIWKCFWNICKQLSYFEGDKGQSEITEMYW